MRYQNLGVIASLICTGLLVSTAASSEEGINGKPIRDVETRELAIIVDGNRIGKNLISEELLEGMIRTTDALEFTTRQKGQKRVTSTVVTEYIEDESLRPISIVKKVNVPNLSYSMTAVVDGGELEVTRKDAHSSYIERYPLVENFLLANGIKSSLSDAVEKNASNVVYQSWDFNSNSFSEVKLSIDIPEERTNDKYWKIKKEVKIHGELDQSFFYTDEKFNFKDAQYQLAGKNFHLMECVDSCEKESSKPFNNFSARFLDSPYLITDDAREGTIRYNLVYRGKNAFTVPNTSDQVVQSDTGSEYVIDVCLSCSDESDEINEAYIQNNMWVQSNHPDIKKEAKRRAKQKYSDHKKMKKLRSYVERHMSGKIQYLGYGSALDAYEQQLGDCTEIALLLTALARSVEIPARVAIGFAYSAEEIEDKKHVFVPHAWVQAYVDGKWRNYDAALGEVDSGYITLGVTDGSMPSLLKIARKMNYFDIVGVSQVVHESQATNQPLVNKLQVNKQQVVEHASL